MVHHHGDVRDLLRAPTIALDWRKCWLGAVAVAAILVGLELLVAVTSLGSLHLFDVPEVVQLASGDAETRGFLVAWAFGAALWTALVLAFCGGGIARLAAIEMTTGRRPPLGQGLSFARRRARAFFYGPLGGLALAVLFCVPALLAGMVGRLGWGVGPVVTVLVYPLVLGFALVATLLVIGTIGGWGLIMAAVAIEGSDPLDAISRAINYLYSRPWHALGYRLAVWAYAAILYLAALVVGGAVWLASEWLVGSTMGADHARLVGPLHALLRGEPVVPSLAGGLYCLVAAGFVCTLGGVGLSYLYSSAVAEYLLLRQRVDGTAPTEMQLDERVEEYGELAFDPLLLDDEDPLETQTPEDARDAERVASAHP